MPVSRGTVVECTAATLQNIGDRPWHSVVGIPPATVVRGTIGDAVGLHTYRISFVEGIYRDGVVPSNHVTVVPAQAEGDVEVDETLTDRDDSGDDAPPPVGAAAVQHKIDGVVAHVVEVGGQQWQYSPGAEVLVDIVDADTVRTPTIITGIGWDPANDDISALWLKMFPAFTRTAFRCFWCPLSGVLAASHRPH